MEAQERQDLKMLLFISYPREAVRVSFFDCLWPSPTVNNTLQLIECMVGIRLSISSMPIHATFHISSYHLIFPRTIRSENH